MEMKNIRFQYAGRERNPKRRKIKKGVGGKYFVEVVAGFEKEITSRNWQHEFTRKPISIVINSTREHVTVVSAQMQIFAEVVRHLLCAAAGIRRVEQHDVLKIFHRMTTRCSSEWRMA